MVHHTKGIVLRTIKYGETSVICAIFTELLGLQSYIIKGVRSAAKSSRQKANILFPSSILDMVVYQKPNQGLNNIKEFYPAVLYKSIQEEVVKNCVALFAVEVMQQILMDHDPQPDLFSFLEQFLLTLDASYRQEVANLPLFLLIQSGKLAGYHISGQYSERHPFVDVYEGRFSVEPSGQPPFISGAEAELMSRLNQAQTFNDIQSIIMKGHDRQHILQYFITFLQMHVPHFKPLKTVPVLTSILY